MLVTKEIKIIIKVLKIFVMSLVSVEDCKHNIICNLYFKNMSMLRWPKIR